MTKLTKLFFFDYDKNMIGLDFLSLRHFFGNQ